MNFRLTWFARRQTESVTSRQPGQFGGGAAVDQKNRQSRSFLYVARPALSGRFAALRVVVHCLGHRISRDHRSGRHHRGQPAGGCFVPGRLRRRRQGGGFRLRVPWAVTVRSVPATRYETRRVKVAFRCAADRPGSNCAGWQRADRD